MCAGCHDLTEFSVSVHPPYDESECAFCHDPHGNNNRFYLRKELKGLCFECHSDKMPAENANIHSPFEDCLNCHNPHSSKFNRLLRKNLKTSRYVPFSVLSYELCFDCHDMEMVFKESNFKAGKKNLHQVHVKRKKGRNCLLCHDPHFSDNEKLLKSGFTFGPNSYLVRIDIKKENGKKYCLPACHDKKEFGK